MDMSVIQSQKKSTSDYSKDFEYLNVIVLMCVGCTLYSVECTMCMGCGVNIG